MRNILIGLIIAGITIAALIIFMGKNSTIPQEPPVNKPAQANRINEVSSSMQGKNIITLTSSGFSPSSLSIKKGDKVTWINKSGTVATVNSLPHPSHTDYPPLNLGPFQNGENLSLSFNESGTYKYHDHLNPGRHGAIVVQ